MWDGLGTHCVNQHYATCSLLEPPRKEEKTKTKKHAEERPEGRHQKDRPQLEGDGDDGPRQESLGEDGRRSMSQGSVRHKGIVRSLYCRMGKSMSEGSKRSQTGHKPNSSLLKDESLELVPLFYLKDDNSEIQPMRLFRRKRQRRHCDNEIGQPSIPTRDPGISCTRDRPSYDKSYLEKLCSNHRGYNYPNGDRGKKAKNYKIQQPHDFCSRQNAHKMSNSSHCITKCYDSAYLQAKRSNSGLSCHSMTPKQRRHQMYPSSSPTTNTRSARHWNNVGYEYKSKGRSPINARSHHWDGKRFPRKSSPGNVKPSSKHHRPRWMKDGAFSSDDSSSSSLSRRSGYKYSAGYRTGKRFNNKYSTSHSRDSRNYASPEFMMPAMHGNERRGSIPVLYKTRKQSKRKKPSMDVREIQSGDTLVSLDCCSDMVRANKLDRSHMMSEQTPRNQKIVHLSPKPLQGCGCWSYAPKSHKMDKKALRELMTRNQSRNEYIMVT